MRDWKSLLGIMLVFVLGGFAGAFVSLAVVHHRTTAILKRGSLAYEELLERHLSHRLDLDPGQRARFHQAFMSNIEERKELQAQIQPRMRMLDEQTRQQIRSILTPGQLLQFHRNLVDFRHRFGSPHLGPQSLKPGPPPTLMTNNAPDETGTNSPPAPDQL